MLFFLKKNGRFEINFNILSPAIVGIITLTLKRYFEKLVELDLHRYVPFLLVMYSTMLQAEIAIRKSPERFAVHES